MVALRYFQASNNENIGNTEHEDGNCVTFVLQDEVGGLEVLKNGDWFPVVPAEGTIVVTSQRWRCYRGNCRLRFLHKIKTNNKLAK